MTGNNIGNLFICPTPIGNLEDITLRTIKTLKEVDFIACEDTRVTQKLLNHFDIKTKLISYHKFSENEKTSYIVDLIRKGNNIALVSDAGTPIISDPGSSLIEGAIQKNIKIIPLPGASSITTAISASPLKGTSFVFIGFLPKTETDLKNILLKYVDTKTICFESPNRLLKTLKMLSENFKDRKVTITRELTKIYEEIKTDTTSNLLEYYSNNPPKGEVTIIIEAAENKEIIELEEKIKKLSKEGFSNKEISKILSLLFPVQKNVVYKAALQINE